MVNLMLSQVISLPTSLEHNLKLSCLKSVTSWCLPWILLTWQVAHRSRGSALQQDLIKAVKASGQSSGTAGLCAS